MKIKISNGDVYEVVSAKVDDVHVVKKGDVPIEDFKTKDEAIDYVNSIEFLNEIKPDINILREMFVNKKYDDIEADFFNHDLPDSLDADCYMEYKHIHDTFSDVIVEKERTHSRYLVIFTDAENRTASRLYFNFSLYKGIPMLISIEE